MSAGVPRVRFEQLAGPLADRLRPRVERLGYLGEFFQIAAHQPDTLTAFIDFTEAGKAALPANLVELTALTMASLAGNDYERNQHERLALTLGWSASWVRAVEALEPPSLDDEAERATQTYLLAAFPTQGRDARQAFDALVSTIGPADAVAVMLVAGRYLAHALVVNSVGLAPPVPSIWDDAISDDAIGEDEG